MAGPWSHLTQLGAYAIRGLMPFVPGKASWREGWVARFDSFDANPFLSDINDRRWKTSDGRQLSLRDLGAELVRIFRPSIERYADERSMRLIDAVMAGQVPSLLELKDRPPRYDTWGRLCTGANPFPI